jgi:hypothetical protein
MTFEVAAGIHINGKESDPPGLLASPLVFTSLTSLRVLCERY